MPPKSLSEIKSKGTWFIKRATHALERGLDGFIEDVLVARVDVAVNVGVT